MERGTRTPALPERVEMGAALFATALGSGFFVSLTSLTSFVPETIPLLRVARARRAAAASGVCSFLPMPMVEKKLGRLLTMGVSSVIVGIGVCVGAPFIVS